MAPEGFYTPEVRSPNAHCRHGLLLAVLCRLWLQCVLIKPYAIGGQIECKRVVKWSAISHVPNVPLQHEVLVNSSQGTPKYF